MFSYFDKLSIERGDTLYIRIPAAVVSNYLTLAWPLFNTINIDNNKIVSLLNSCNICQLRFHVIMFNKLCLSKHAFPPVRLLHHTASKYILLTNQSILAIVAPSTWPCPPSTPTSPGQPAWTRSGTRQSQLCKMPLYYISDNTVLHIVRFTSYMK